MAVGAAHAERADPGDQSRLGAGPSARHVLDPQAERRQRDARVRGREVEAGRQLPVADREHGLDQADDPRRAFQMADVGLHRADPQRRLGRPAGPERGTEGGRLDRVTDRCPGPVQFDVLHVARGEPAPPVGRADHLLLGLRLRRGQRLATAVVVHRAARDDAVHGVAVGERARQRLEHHDRATLATHVAVGARVEGEAAPVRGETAQLGRVTGLVGDQVQVDAADQGDFGLASTQALTGGVDGDERRRLGRVDGHAGAAQTERVRDPVGNHAAMQAGHLPRTGGDSRAAQQRCVVVPDRAREDADRMALQPVRRDTRLFQCLPAQFEHQPLLRVHERGLARGNAEERRVETVDAVEKSPTPLPTRRGGTATGTFTGNHLQPLEREFRDGVGAIGEQVPELTGSGRSRHPTGDADNRNRVIAIRFDCAYDSIRLGHTAPSHPGVIDTTGRRRQMHLDSRALLAATTCFRTRPTTKEHTQIGKNHQINTYGGSPGGRFPTRAGTNFWKLITKSPTEGNVLSDMCHRHTHRAATGAAPASPRHLQSHHSHPRAQPHQFTTTPSRAGTEILVPCHRRAVLRRQADIQTFPMPRIPAWNPRTAASAR